MPLCQARRVGTFFLLTGETRGSIIRTVKKGVSALGRIKNGGEPGHSRRAISPEKLRAQVGDYMARCSEENVFPDLAGMRLFLGRSQQELDELSRDAELKKILDYAADCRESWLVRHMTADNKLTTGCFNALRQSCNGGYSDKSARNSGPCVVEFTGNIDPEDFL